MSIAKLAKLGMTALKNNVTTLEHPYKLTFSITYSCQSRCITCGIWQIRPKGELALPEIEEFAKKNLGFRWIEITGGEPFVRGDVVEIVKAFKTYSKDLYIVTMPTNSLCNCDMVIGKINEILELGIPKLSITVSLDGYRELHDRIRGIPGNFDKAMAMFKGLKELRKEHNNLFFVFGYTMSKFNQGEFQKTYEEVKKEIPDVTYNDFHLNMGQISDSYYQNSGIDLKADREKAAEELRGVIKNRRFQIGVIPQIEGVFLKKLAEYAITNKTPMKSKSMDASLFLDSYGNVYPSIMWGRKIGNIRDVGYDLGKIWHNSEAEEIRRLIKEGKEPDNWTACEAYQTIVGNVKGILL